MPHGYSGAHAMRYFRFCETVMEDAQAVLRASSSRTPAVSSPIYNQLPYSETDAQFTHGSATRAGDSSSIVAEQAAYEGLAREIQNFGDEMFNEMLAVCAEIDDIMDSDLSLPLTRVQVKFVAESVRALMSPFKDVLTEATTVTDRTRSEMLSIGEIGRGLALALAPASVFIADTFSAMRTQRLNMFNYAQECRNYANHLDGEIERIRPDLHATRWIGGENEDGTTWSQEVACTGTRDAATRQIGLWEQEADEYRSVARNVDAEADDLELSIHTAANLSENDNSQIVATDAHFAREFRRLESQMNSIKQQFNDILGSFCTINGITNFDAFSNLLRNNPELQELKTNVLVQREVEKFVVNGYICVAKLRDLFMDVLANETDFNYAVLLAIHMDMRFRCRDVLDFYAWFGDEIGSGRGGRLGSVHSLFRRIALDIETMFNSEFANFNSNYRYRMGCDVRNAFEARLELLLHRTQLIAFIDNTPLRFWSHFWDACLDGFLLPSENGNHPPFIIFRGDPYVGTTLAGLWDGLIALADLREAELASDLLAQISDPDRVAHLITLSLMVAGNVKTKGTLALVTSFATSIQDGVKVIYIVNAETGHQERITEAEYQFIMQMATLGVARLGGGFAAMETPTGTHIIGYSLDTNAAMINFAGLANPPEGSTRPPISPESALALISQENPAIRQLIGDDMKPMSDVKRGYGRIDVTNFVDGRNGCTELRSTIGRLQDLHDQNPDRRVDLIDDLSLQELDELIARYEAMR